VLRNSEREGKGFQSLDFEGVVSNATNDDKVHRMSQEELRRFDSLESNYIRNIMQQ